MRKLLLFGFAALLVIVSHAQNSEKKWSIGVFGGKTEYNGDLGNAFIFKKGKAFYPFGAISVNRYLNRSFDVGIFSSFGEYGYKNLDKGNFHGDKLDISGLLTYKLANGYLFKENAIFAPYIAAGVGWAHYAGSRIWNGRDFLMPVGGGIKVNFSPTVALQYQLLYNFTNHDKRDQYPTNGHHDQFASHSLGFVFSFGKSSKKVVEQAVIPPVEAPAPPAKQPETKPQPQPKPEPKPEPAPVVQEKHGQYGETLRVHFDFNKSELRKKDYPILDGAAQTLANNPSFTVTVTGHADNLGTKEVNDAISVKRAEAVKAYLIKKGVQPSQIMTQGKGFDEPIASNATADGRQQNRRSEIVITF